MGRKVTGNRDRGHFQDRARQLTSSAFGRAILWRRMSRLPSSPQRKLVTLSLRAAAPVVVR